SSPAGLASASVLHTESAPRGPRARAARSAAAMARSVATPTSAAAAVGHEPDRREALERALDPIRRRVHALERASDLARILLALLRAERGERRLHLAGEPLLDARLLGELHRADLVGLAQGELRERLVDPLGAEGHGD